MTLDVGDARIRSLAAVARALGLSVQLNAMIEIAAEEALKALPAASLSISRLEQGTGAIRTLINVGTLGPDERRWPDNEVYRLEDFFFLQGVVGELRIWTMSLEDPHPEPGEAALLKSLGKGSSMGGPLIVDGKLWGELYATREVGARRFNDGDIAYVEALAAILSGGISRALHVDTLEQMAFHDPLTGLANRRALDRAAAMAFDGVAEQAARTVSVVAVDINLLKEVNDQFGHAEGDRLLTSVAQIMQRHFGPLHGSLVARIGGDEFTVLVPGHHIDRVRGAAAAVCDDTAALPIGTGVSCGIATTTIGVDDFSSDEIFRRADQAQYRAKRLELRIPCLFGAPPPNRSPLGL
ncbi:MAG TPA: sensor domain-containing diguanylate cyclase [Nocardioidaceae bacterium]|nr:sensor domain-containing diguanylate cyclase [Nocardioidaceae bacterium]